MRHLHPIILLILAMAVISCNPECDSLYSINVDSITKQQGHQMLIKGGDVNALHKSEIQFLKGSVVKVATVIDRTEEGLIVEVPEDIEGDNIQLMVNDPDCGLVVLGTSILVGSADFFANNSDFIPPAPVEIVIPTPPIAAPPLVQNAWISPQNTDYCIWFRFLPKMDAGGNTSTIEVNGETFLEESINIDPVCSFELSVRELICEGGAGPQCAPGFCQGNVTRLYHCNPIRGIIDKENNFINFWIDRSNHNGQNLGIEEFTGEFININNTPYNDARIPSCSSSSWDPNKVYLMLITSQKTGRQLVLYQQGVL